MYPGTAWWSYELEFGLGWQMAKQSDDDRREWYVFLSTTLWQLLDDRKLLSNQNQTKF